jgi:hypothetical protein
MIVFSFNFHTRASYSYSVRPWLPANTASGFVLENPGCSIIVAHCQLIGRVTVVIHNLACFGIVLRSSFSLLFLLPRRFDNFSHLLWYPTIINRVTSTVRLKI